EWWPDLTLSVYADRGDAGVRWTVTGAVTGSMEVWLEPFGDGVILHYYLRAEPAGRPARSPYRAAAAVQRRQRATRLIFWALKEEWGGDRRAGEPRPGAGRSALGESAAAGGAPQGRLARGAVVSGSP